MSLCKLNSNLHTSKIRWHKVNIPIPKGRMGTEKRMRLKQTESWRKIGSGSPSSSGCPSSSWECGGVKGYTWDSGSLVPWVFSFQSCLGLIASTACAFPQQTLHIPGVSVLPLFLSSQFPIAALEAPSMDSDSTTVAYLLGLLLKSGGSFQDSLTFEFCMSSKLWTSKSSASSSGYLFGTDS